MNDLEKTRNHAREMAAPGAHTRDCPVKVAHDRYLDGRIELRVAACSKAVDRENHAGHTWMESDQWRPDQSWQRWCHGACSGCVSDAERALWAQIADEINEYIYQPPDEQGALPL